MMIRTQPALTAGAALSLVAAVTEAAEQSGLPIAVAVADPAGHLLAALRMDGVSPPILGFATDKAFTAATMRRSTADFGTRMTSSPTLSLGLSTRVRLLPWGGGLPVVHEGQVVGGLGVSGAQDHEDIALGQAALQALGLGWHP